MKTSCSVSYLFLRLILAFGLSGCVQTVDRPPIRLLPTSAAMTEPLQEPRLPISTGRAIDSAVRALAQDLVSNAPAMIRTKRIAILPMRDLSGSLATMAVTAHEAFRVELFRAAPLQFVADNDMSRAIQELRIEDDLRKNYQLDRAVVKSIGKLLSAELIVDSRISDSFTEMRLTAEIFEISTGRLLSTAAQLLPKSVVNVGSVGKQTQQVGRVLSAGDDWLQTRLDSVRVDKDKIIRAKFIFFNRSQTAVRLALKDPQRRTYLVDGSGVSFAYLGAEGFDSRGEIDVRPETRHEVDILFTSSQSTNGLLTMRTVWYARGPAKAEQEFVVRDIVVSR